MPGVGKSELAAQVVAHALETHKYRAYFWIRATSKEQIFNDYLRIATTLGLVTQNTPTEEIEEILVRELNKEDQWVLVFDNLESVGLVQGKLPDPSGTRHVLITTRYSQQCPSLEAKIMEVLELSPEESVQMFKSFYQNLAVHETDIARELMVELGHLPLAIIQSAAYLDVEPMPVSKYLDNYRKKHEESVWTYRPIEDLSYVPVGVVLSMSLERIKDNDVARRLICLISFLHPDTIPVALLSGDPIFKDTRLRQAFSNANERNGVLRLLAAYQFIRRSEDTISIHRLVQRVVRDILSFENTEFTMLSGTDQYWIERAIEVVWIAYPDQPSSNNWGTCTDLYQHAATAVEHGETLKDATKEFIYLEGALGTYTLDYGLYCKAGRLLRHLLSFKEYKYGVDHINTANTINNLGNTYDSQGKYEEAIGQYERALKIYEKAFGVDHINTADTINNLGNTYSQSGQV